MVRADSARLQQIFWNLLKNAVKFTPAGGQIVVSSRNEECSVLRGQRPRGAESAEAEPVRLSPRSSVQGATCHPCLVVSFSDTGIGIQPDLLPRIFDAFEQGERVVSRQFGGLGLGLAISRALVEAHGGEVSAVSEGPGRGATFSVCLPTIAAPAARPEVSSSAGGEAEAKPLARILLVDDHADTSRAMKRLLQRLGYDIETADSVHSALARAKNRAFDLLISDIGLPDGSGLDLMRDIQNVQKIQGIALSGFGMDEDVRRSKEAGFAEHLTKPVNFQRLESVIRQLTH